MSNPIPMSLESSVNIQIVHSGYVLNGPGADGNYKSEVFTSTTKLIRAVRAMVEEHTLLQKKDDSDQESK